MKDIKTKLQDLIAESNEMIEHNRKLVSENLSDSISAMQHLNTMATYEGRLRAYTVIAEHDDPMNAHEWMLDLALENDDTWSGRTNDIRRSKQDGVRYAINEIGRLIAARTK